MHLTKTLVTVSLLIPASAYSLGIGDIKLHSALNQNLDAEIALIISPNEKVTNLKVNLAPPEKFDEAGIPWNYFLSKIKFKPIFKKNGLRLIQISSQEPLREPFLDFLLEVRWNKGSLFREFTVLIDPPTAYTQPTSPVISKPSQTANTQVTANKANSQQTVIAGQYGPTKPADSLWKIAAKTNAYQGVSVEQMIMAIYQANPQAFYKKNVNALMAGKTLVIPDRESIIQISRDQALTMFRQQTKQWRAMTSSSPRPLARTAVKSQLELEAPEKSDIASSTRLVSSSSNKNTTYDGSANGLPRTEVLALQARMARLEQQLNRLQKMLLVKDEQIAILQNKKELIIASDDAYLAPGKTVDDVVKSSDTPIQQDHSKSQTPVKQPAGTTHKPPVPKVQTQKPAASEKPLVKEDDSSLLSIILTTISLAVLALLGLFLWRKRNEELADEESMFATASEISLPDSISEDISSPVIDESSYDVGTVGESSFLSEFTPSEFDSFDTDQGEVDPISETDVYLAYGRYQQAEELMRQAIEDQPDRDENKLKLLEIFYASENKEAFIAYATELASAGKDTDQEFWDKVKEMGVELLPNSTLFSDSADKATETVTEIKDKSETTAINEQDLDPLPLDNKADSNSSNQEIDSPQIEELDFDLSIFDLDQSDNKSVENNDEDLENSIDFDSSTTKKHDLDEKEDKTATNSDDELESFEFDIPAESVRESERDDDIGIVDLSNEPDSDESLESFDFSSITGESETETKQDSVEKAVEKTDDLDNFDFSFDFDDNPPTLDKLDDDDPEALSIGVSDLTDADELETKIDLAKAYIDMGDPAAAKEIAQEVLEKGNEKQQKTAQSLLDSL